MIARHSNYQIRTVWLARASSLLFFYGVVASMAAANIGMALTLVFWLVSGVWVHRFSAVRESPIFLPVITLVFVTVASLGYSVAPHEYANRYFLVYGKLLFIFVLLTIHDDPSWLKKIFLVLGIAVGVVLLSTYANIYFDLPWVNSSGGFGANNSVFYDYIAQGVMSACAAIAAWVIACRTKEGVMRYFSIFVFLTIVISVFFLLPSRTGQLALFIALFVVSCLLFRPRHFLIFCGVAACLALGALILYPVMLAKLQLIFSEGSAFFRQGAEISSVGARLSMWMNSLNFIFEAPLFGHGVGSYRFLAEKVFLDPVMCSISCVHPHNQLLFFMVEYGVFGLLIFGMFLYAFFVVARFWRGRSLDAYAMVAGILTIFLVDSFINSPLWISSLRNFYIGMFSLIFIHYAIAKKAK